MSFRLVKTSGGKTTASLVAAEGATERAEALWADGTHSLVKLVSETGVVFWKRGTHPEPDREAEEQAALAEAAGLSHLRLASPEIGGVADLDKPLARNATSFEVDVEGRTLDGLLKGDGTPRLNDLLRFVEAQLGADMPAALTGWEVHRGGWPNPAHQRITVALG